jgi:hypothetical protein
LFQFLVDAGVIASKDAHPYDRYQRGILR